MRNHQNHDDPESLLKRKYSAPTPPDSFLRDLDVRLRGELERRNRGCVASGTATTSGKGLAATVRTHWRLASTIAACLLLGPGIWLLGPTENESQQMAKVNLQTSDSEQAGAPEPDARGSLDARLMRYQASEDKAPHARRPHDTANGGRAGYAGAKRPSANMSRSAYVVEITTADRVSEASAIVRAKFIDFADNNQSRWQVKKVLYGQVPAEVVVSTHLMPPSRPRDLPEGFESMELTYEQLTEINFAIPLHSPWTLKDDILLYLGECSDSDVDGEVHCAFTSVQYQNYGYDLDEVEVEIQRVIESGEHLTTEPGDEPGLPRRLNAKTERSG